jgi:hypothetical protein
MPNAAHECNSRSVVRRPVIWRLYPPESADSAVDRSDRRENAPKTGKIVKIAGFGATEGPMEGSAGLQNQVSSAI